MTQFTYGTSVNNQPNYLVDMNISDQLAQNRDSFNGVMAGGGGLMGAGTAAQSQATSQQVQPDQLVENRLNGLMDRNGAYIGNARERAREFMSGRGGGNSSFAAGAAERSAIEAAMPIAQADAARFGRVGDLNQQFANQHDLANASNQTQLDNTALSGNLRNQGALSQMLLGQDFTAMNDIRRQLFGIEDREDTQAFNAGQFDAGLGLDYARLGENARQWDSDFGLRQDMFAEDRYRFDQGLPLDWFRAYAAARAPYDSGMWNAAGAALSNPNIPADAAPGIFNNIQQYGQQSWNQPAPAWMQGWFQNPPQSVGQGASQAAAGLPPMGP